MKASKLETDKRVFAIQGWIIEGVQDYLIEKQIMTDWNIGLRQAKRYIKMAYDNWKKDAEITVENKRAAKIAELKQLKRSLLDHYKGTPSGITAIMRVEKEIIKLEAIVPPSRIQFGNDPENPVEINQVTVFQLPDNNRD